MNMDVNINGDGTVTISEEFFELLVAKLQETYDDINITVVTVSKIMKLIGLLDKNGVKQDFQAKHIFRQLSSIINPLRKKETLEKFAFISEAMPIIDKYSFLYKQGEINDVPSIASIINYIEPKQLPSNEQ
jgi:hypothetical protein